MTQCGKDPLALETDAAVSRGLWEAGKGQKTQTPPRPPPVATTKSPEMDTALPTPGFLPSGTAR